MGRRDMATLASVHGGARGVGREGRRCGRRDRSFWLEGEGMNVAAGVPFLPKASETGTHRQEWLRVQKGRRGQWRGSNWARVGRQGPELARGPASHLHANHSSSALPQKLTVDLTAVRGVLQSQQQHLQHRARQKELVAGSSRLYDIYWQAMRVLGVQ